MKKGKMLYMISIVLFLLSCIYISVKYIILLQYPEAFLGFAASLFILIPSIAEKLFKLKINYELRIFIVVFCLLAFNLGVALKWYKTINSYDNFVHGLSGMLFTIIGFCVYFVIKGKKGANRRSNWLLQLTYAVFFSFFVAVLWEIFEFLDFNITGHDAQHTLTTGVFDTMTDLISSSIGSVIVAIDYFTYIKSNTNSIISKSMDSFYELNS